MTVFSCHVTCAFQSECWIANPECQGTPLLKAGAKSEVWVTATGLEPRTT